MKAIIFSDIHLHKWPKFNEGNKRTKNQLEVLSSLFKTAHTKDVPIIFGGDMFIEPEGLKNSLLSMTLPFLIDLFNRYPVDLYAISGNHDLESDNTFMRRAPSYINTLANSIKRFHNLDFHQQEFQDFVVYGIPYIRYNDGLMDYINKLKLHPTKKNILLLHTDFKGQKDTNGITVGKGENLNEGKLERFDLVLSGHIHKAGRIRKNIYSIGSPMQIRLSDMNGAFGYWTLSDDFKMTFREITTTPKFRYYTDESEVDNDFDFWVKAPKKDDEIEDLIQSDVDLGNRVKLVRSYLKWRGVKGFSRERFLLNLIKEIDEQ